MSRKEGREEVKLTHAHFRSSRMDGKKKKRQSLGLQRMKEQDGGISWLGIKCDPSNTYAANDCNVRCPFDTSNFTSAGQNDSAFQQERATKRRMCQMEDRYTLPHSPHVRSFLPSFLPSAALYFHFQLSAHSARSRMRSVVSCPLCWSPFSRSGYPFWAAKEVSPTKCSTENNEAHIATQGTCPQDASKSAT